MYIKYLVKYVILMIRKVYKATSYTLWPMVLKQKQKQSDSGISIEQRIVHSWNKLAHYQYLQRLNQLFNS